MVKANQGAPDPRITPLPGSVDNNEITKNADTQKQNREAPNGSGQATGTVNVFVSYSHQDKNYVTNPDSLLHFLLPLRQFGIRFWWDKLLDAGDIWSDEIEGKLNEANIALLLVSHYFLTSSYIRNTEIKSFVTRRKEQGMIIFPVILSPCDWKAEEWLKQTQFEPRNGENIEEHYADPGRKKALFLKIYKTIQKIGSRVLQRP